MSEPIEQGGYLPPYDYIMVPANVNEVASSRSEFLKTLLHQGTCIEIGVAQGGFTKRILEICKPKKLYAIDPWGGNTLIDDEVIFRENFEHLGNVEIIKQTSQLASRMFGDELIDWIYLDAIHDEKYVFEDLVAWWPKIKPGGFLIGHDFCTTGTWCYGVVQAVFDFVRKTFPAPTLGMTTYIGEEFPSFILWKVVSG